MARKNMESLIELNPHGAKINTLVQAESMESNEYPLIEPPRYETPNRMPPKQNKLVVLESQVSIDEQMRSTEPLKADLGHIEMRKQPVPVRKITKKKSMI